MNTETEHSDIHYADGQEIRLRPHLIHEQDNTTAFTARWNGAHGKGQTADRVILLPGQTLLRTRA